MEELERKLDSGDTPDYISLAGSGEPTLNSRIGDLVGRIKKSTKIPVAVLTNGSLLWIKKVRDDLESADLVLPSLDAGDEQMFRYVNRPRAGISFKQVVDGIAEFTGSFSGEVWLEVLLLAGVTGIFSEVNKIADIVRRIRPARIQLNTVTRPPAEEFAYPLNEHQMEKLGKLFPGNVEIISDFKRQGRRPRFKFKAGDSAIIALLGRRPCTCADVASGLNIHMNEAIKHLEALIKAGDVKTAAVEGKIFYSIAGSEDISRP